MLPWKTDPLCGNFKETISFSGVYSSESNSGGFTGADPKSRLSGGPYEREPGTSYCGGTEKAGSPIKSRTTILRPMKQIRNRREENRQELALYRHAPEFVPAGQSTQMIVGAAGESDYQIVSVAEALYRQFSLKRVFYSAFVSVNEDKDLPVLPQGPPL